MGAGLALVLILVLAPLLFTDFYLSQVITKALWLGIAAASLIFLAAYVGMVSLGQVALYGIAGFTMANLVEADGGSTIALEPVGGDPGGHPRRRRCRSLLRRDREPELRHLLPDDHARRGGPHLLLLRPGDRALGLRRRQQRRPARHRLESRHGSRRTCSTSRSDASAVVYVFVRYLARTPFGLALQGVRDDPSRMRALGYNVPLLRMLAFGLGALIASFAGILSVWWNTRISPGSIDLSRTIDVLVIAVIGGLYRLEGAWIGAFVFVALDNWTRGVDIDRPALQHRDRG